VIDVLRYYKKKFDIVAALFVVSLCVLVVTVSILLTYFVQNKLNHDKIDELNNIVEEEVEVDEDNKIDRYAKVRDKYPDLVGFITYYYYNNKVKLPLMQTGDNDYYLYRDVEGIKSKAGTPFIDFRCDIENSLLLVLYAHNMKDLSQFGALKEYRSESYRKSHPYLYFETKYHKEKKYEVVAAFYSEVYPPGMDVFRYYAYFDLPNKATYDYYMYNIKRLAEYDTGIKPKFGDKLILLSTCDYTKKKKDGRFAVLAREVIAVDIPKGTDKPVVMVTATPKPVPTASNSNPVRTDKPTTRPQVSPTVKPTIRPTATPRVTVTPIPTPRVTVAPQTMAPTNEPVTQAPEPTMPTL